MSSDITNKRILYVVNDAWFFVSHRIAIVDAAVRAGAECHVAAHHDDTVTQILDTGAHFHHWDVRPRGKSVLTELKTLFALYKLIKKTKPDVLHLVTIKPVLYGGILARLMRIKSVVFAISGMGHLFQDKAAKPTLLQKVAQQLYRYVMFHPNAAVIVQNVSDGAFFTDNLNIDSDRVYQLPGSGVNLEQYKNQERNNAIPVVVLTARMLWDKGIAYYVEAAQAIKQQGLDARFLLIGGTDPDNPRSIPLDQLQEWHEAGAVEYLGHSNNVSAELLKADIYCLPTAYGEGLPKSILEALASGCAVITTDWPGCNEVIDHGTNGLLVPAKDVPALTNALIQLITDSEQVQTFGRNGRKTVEDGYGVELVVEKHLDIYQSLVKAHD